MSDFVYEDDYQWFTTTISLPDTIGVQVSNPIEVLALTPEWAGMSDGRTKALSAEQQAAFNSLTEQLPGILDKVIEFLTEEIVAMYGLDQMPDDFPEDGSAEDQQAYFRKDLYLTGISLLMIVTNGRGDIAIDFNSEEVDPEHGFSVWVQDGLPISSAGAGEQGGC